MLTEVVAEEELHSRDSALGVKNYKVYSSLLFGLSHDSTIRYPVGGYSSRLFIIILWLENVAALFQHCKRLGR